MSEQYVEINEKLREKNFAFFENRYGFKPHIDEHENELYYSERTGSDSVAVFIKNGNITGDLRLNSIYDPDYEAARWAENHDMINRRTTIALLGVSNGSYSHLSE